MDSQYLKNIILVGYLGGPNIGDESLARAVLDKVSNKKQVVVMSGNPEITRKMIGDGNINVLKDLYPGRFLTFREYIELINVVKNAERLIFVGGGILQNVHSNNLLIKTAFFSALCTLFNKKTYAIGIGFGPLNTYIAGFLAKFIIRRVDIIYSRDNYSYNEIKKISGYSTPRILEGVDTAFSFESISANKKEDTIGICFRDWKGFDKQILVSLIKSLVKKEKKILMLSYEPQDVDFYKSVTCHIKTDNITIVQPKTVMHAREIISELEGLISMRLHANIFSVIEGVPFAAISYDPKILNIFSRINLEKNVLGIESNFEDILRVLSESIRLSRQERKLLQIKASEMILDVIESTVKYKTTIKDYFLSVIIALYVFVIQILIPNIRYYSKASLRLINIKS